MRVVSINISSRKGVKKRPIKSCRIIEDFGLASDSHSGRWHRQVSLLALESIKKARSLGLSVDPGDFAENITTEGIDLKSLPIGARLKIGRTVLLEITQIGKSCHSKCTIYEQVGKCVMPTEGIFARVLKGGVVNVDDEINKVISNDKTQ